MPVVCTTSVVVLSPLHLDDLKDHEFIHKKRKPDRRKRRTDCFHHVILRNPQTDHVFLLYSNGKCVILGPKSITEIHMASSWISLILRNTIRKRVELKNIVYVYNALFKELGEPDTLSLLHARLKSQYPKLQFDPELSPALMFNPLCCCKAKVMIFRTGRVNITGLSCFKLVNSVKTEIESVLQ